MMLFLYINVIRIIIYQIDIFVNGLTEILDLKIGPDEAFSSFISSKTGELLYDEESTLWWNGPSYIADMYKSEIGVSQHFDAERKMKKEMCE